MFFFVMTKNWTCEILTKNSVTFENRIGLMGWKIMGVYRKVHVSNV